jgi:hypothetical protein
MKLLMARSRLGRLGLAAAGIVALTVATGAFGGSSAALADPLDGQTSNAELTWKVSQQAWTASSLAPSRDATTPAIFDETNGFVFPEGAGIYDPATGEASIQFSGSLQIGNVSQGGYKIKLIDPAIAIDANGDGSLIADVSYCTGSAGSSPCSGTWPVTANVVVVNFSVENGTLTDTGSEVTLTVTPDYPLQNDPSFPTRGQFPQSFLDSISAATPSLLGHFRDSGAGADPNKPPAPFTLTFDYVVPLGATQTITTEVQSVGGLSLSVEGTQVSLPTPVLNVGGDALVSSGSINEVTVVDLRTSNPGWNLTGQVSAFTSSTSSFDGTHLGWTPELVSSSPNQTVTAGAPVAPGTGIAASSTLGSAMAGEGRGTAVLGADLELSIPTDTEPGDYSATLTITVI